VGKKSDDKPEPTRPVGDVAFVMGKNADGVHIIRRRAEDAPIEAGLLQPLVEGKPITGELISMRRREDAPFLFDVKSELAAPSSDSSSSEGSTGRPAKVATDSYRKGWDAIWGGRANPSRRPGRSNRDVN
jgi:hypothetical protein